MSGTGIACAARPYPGLRSRAVRCAVLSKAMRVPGEQGQGGARAERAGMPYARTFLRVAPYRLVLMPVLKDVRY
eukprot:3537087-Rhodomonas_salina.1